MALPNSESVGTFGWADSATSLSVGTFGWVLPAVGIGATTVISMQHRRIIEEDEAWLILEPEMGLV